MQKIIPHLWFDTQAIEAAEFYTSIFPNSRIHSTSQIKNTPSGDCDIVSFNVMGYLINAISAGPLFTFNPSISLMVNFDPAQDPEATTRIDEVWNKLIEGGRALMPLDAYPFSKRFGWVQDKYGFTWQLILTDPAGEPRPPIIPCLLFVTPSGMVAEEATEFYLSIFRQAKRGQLQRVLTSTPTQPEGSVLFTDLQLEHQWFVAMDGLDHVHPFAFNEAVSLMVQCGNQAEIDYYWNALSAVKEAEQCGWLKDRYGLSWQIVPNNLDKLMGKNPEKTTPVLLRMKKIEIAELEKAG